MREVSTRIWFAVLSIGKHLAVPQEVLLEAAGVPRGELEAPGGRFDWEVFARIAARLGELAPSTDALAEAGHAAAAAPWTAPVRGIAQMLTSTRPLFRLGFGWFAPLLFYNVRFSLSEVKPNQLRATMEIPAPYSAPPAIFHLTRGSIAATPSYVGADDCRVDLAIDGRRAEYLIHLPERASLLRRVRLVARAVFGARAAVDELIEQQRRLRESFLEVQRQRQDFRRVIDSLEETVVVHRDGTILYANPAFLASLGLPADSDLLGRHIREWLARDEPSLRQEPWLGAGSRGEGGELRLVRPGGELVVLETGAAQPVDFDGPAMLLSARDVSARRRDELRLAVADRLASVGTLASGVAHEINNPLSYVLANLRGLSKLWSKRVNELPVDLHQEVAEMLGDAYEGAERVADIVADLGAFARSDDSAPHDVDLNEILERTLKLAANQIRHRAKLVRDFQPVPPIKASEARLAQVCLHLVVNAAQAIPEGHADENLITVSTSLSGSRVLLTVSDTGPGVPEALRTRIFDPFFTTRPTGAGMGLGLAICHGIVSQLGGHISVDAGARGGSVFSVDLPASPRLSPKPAPPRARTTTPGARARVLIVDDEPRVGTALARALEGHDVQVVRDGRSALGAMLNNDFDLVFCDLMMPEVSGMELFERVKSARPGLERKIVFMTGGAFTEAAQEFLATVDAPCLAKPFRLEQVLALVAQLIP